MLPRLGLLGIFFAAGTSLYAEYKDSAEFQQATKALTAGQFVKVRETAENILRTNSESFEAWYLLGHVYSYGEANLPRARYCYTQARTLLEKKWRPPISLDGPWRIHSMTLNGLIQVASLTDQYQEEIDLIAGYDKLYKPTKLIKSGWALMKLGRIEEARKTMSGLLGSADEYQETTALNTLGAIEAELGNYEKSYEWFTRLKDTVKARKWDMSAVYLKNHSNAAMSLLKFQEAEIDLLEAANYFDKFSTSNPWEDLALLYTGSGRMPEALSAVQKMQDWTGSTEAMLAQQKWSQVQQTAAAVMMAAGLDDESLGILRRLMDRPDRHGTTSASPVLTEIGLLHLYREALKLRRERLREEMSWSGVGDWLRKLGERISIEREIWSTRSRAAALIMGEKRLSWILIPYGQDTTVPEWLRPAMHEIVGDGLWSTELAKQFVQTGGLADRQRPYYLAERGEATKNLDDLTRAEADLPGEETLLRARLNVLLGDAYQASGNLPAALERYGRALEKDPHAFRALGSALPVTIEAASDAASQAAASALRGSPRLKIAKGFVIRVGRSGDKLIGRLEGPSGAVFSEWTSIDSPAAFAKEFHEKAFAARLDLSQLDIGSLEGSNGAATADRAKLRDLLGMRK